MDQTVVRKKKSFAHIDLLQELKCFPKDWSNCLPMELPGNVRLEISYSYLS
jgi:hypothetical protein